MTIPYHQIIDKYLLLHHTHTMIKICGVDEAGRGPIAGPVCAASVTLPKEFPFEILADSKKLSPKRRGEAELIIKERALGWAIGWASQYEIDQINILQATLLAMKRSYLKLSKKVENIDLIMVDGNRAFDADIPCTSVVKGDNIIWEIMAASILAKCARDRLMLFYDTLYPEYGYATHKGYPTATHLKVCRSLGPSPIQRHSFTFQ